MFSKQNKRRIGSLESNLHGLIRAQKIYKYIKDPFDINNVMKIVFREGFNFYNFFWVKENPPKIQRCLIHPEILRFSSF